MIYGSMVTEKKYQKRGYYLYKTGFKYGSEAEEKAKELRENGFFAVAMEYSTMVRGLHDYAVWAKRRKK